MSEGGIATHLIAHYYCSLLTSCLVSFVERRNDQMLWTNDSSLLYSISLQKVYMCIFHVGCCVGFHDHMRMRQSPRLVAFFVLFIGACFIGLYWFLEKLRGNCLNIIGSIMRISPFFLTLDIPLVEAMVGIAIVETRVRRCPLQALIE